MTPLRKRMIEDMQLRNFAPETQRNYLHHIAGLARFFQTSPEHLNLEDIRQYQVYLANDCRYSAQSVNQFVSAVKFLYEITLEAPFDRAALLRARVPNKAPIILSQQEVAHLLRPPPQHPLPRRVHGGLRRRTARLRSGSPQGGGHRLATHAAPRPARQRTTRPIRYAVSAPARNIARLVSRRPSHRVAVSRLARPPPPDASFFAVGLPRWRPSGRTAQTHHGSHAMPQFCHSPAGERYRYPNTVHFGGADHRTLWSAAFGDRWQAA